MHITKFYNSEVGRRSDGRYDTAFILNLTGVPLTDDRKTGLEKNSVYGYSNQKSFGAVVEVVDKMQSYTHNPQNNAHAISHFFKESAREIEGKEHVIRAYYLMLPGKGDPRVGYALCADFVNSSGKVYVNLMDVYSSDKNPESPNIKMAQFVNDKVSSRSDGSMDTVFVLNLTGIRLDKAKKSGMSYESQYGYGDMIRYGAVFEYLVNLERMYYPGDMARALAGAFLDAVRKVAGKRFSSRTYKLMMSRDGDPRFGFCLSSEFINEKGELFVELL